MSDQSGQGTLEYVLVLIVTVGLILALAFQFMAPFRDFTFNIMGRYIQCLLETGELPALGAAGITGSECAVYLSEAAQFEVGPSTTTGVGGEAADRARSVSGDAREGGERGDRAARGQGSRGAEGAGGGGRAGGARHRANLGGPGGSGGGAGEIQGGGGNQPNTGTLNTRARNRIHVGSVQSQGRRHRAVGLAGRIIEERQAEQANRQVRRPAGQVDDERGGQRARRLAVNRDALTADEQEMPSAGWELGNLFRWLLIAAMIIAIFVIVLMQGAQIAKGWQKN